VTQETKDTYAIAKRVKRELDLKESAISTVLPEAFRGDVQRFIARAAFYFSREEQKNEQLADCTLDSKMDCVLKAAELGLCLDGRLAYAVPFKRECQLVVGYKGLCTVARRSGAVKDIFAELACANDEECSLSIHEDGEKLTHKVDFRKPRGDVQGAYGTLVFPDGRRRFVPMTLEELESIRQRSKMKDRGAWVTDTNEMYKKTVIRRAIKLYCDEGLIARAYDLDADNIDTAPERDRVIDMGPAEEIADIAPKAVEAPKEVSGDFFSPESLRQDAKDATPQGARKDNW